MKIIQIYTENQGWINISVERDYDRAFDKAKEYESRLGKDPRISITDSNTGNTDWSNK